MDTDVEVDFDRPADMPVSPTRPPQGAFLHAEQSAACYQNEQRREWGLGIKAGAALIAISWVFREHTVPWACCSKGMLLGHQVQCSGI